MATQRQTAFRLSEDLLNALQTIKERDGVLISEQVRRALTAWVEAKGLRLKKTDRKRVSPRKRP